MNWKLLKEGLPSGEYGVKNIIIDKAHAGLDGRKLLLGEGDFNASLVDVGIGYVHGTGSTQYWSYTCVLSPKRNKKNSE